MVKTMCLAGFVALLNCWPPAHADTECASCHAATATEFHTTAHARAFESRAGIAACTTCHGDATRHLVSPGTPGSILGFDSEPATTVNAACGGCHTDQHKTAANPHTSAGLACTNCHTVHGENQQVDVRRSLPAGLDRVDAASLTCFSCHQDTFTQFAFNERHRLAEGSISCASCHDPHAPARMRLGGAVDQVCTTCHADAAGPFVFEHTASRVEGCTACHSPHGSPNRHLLTHQQVGALCYSCHASVPQFHLGFSPVGAARFDEDTVCTNCHVTIHGSNLDRLFLR